MPYRSSLLIDVNREAEMQWRLANSLSGTDPARCRRVDLADGAAGLEAAVAAFVEESATADGKSFLWIHAPVSAQRGVVSFRVAERWQPLSSITRGGACTVLLDGPADLTEARATAPHGPDPQTPNDTVWVARGARMERINHLSGRIPAGEVADAYAFALRTHSISGIDLLDPLPEGGAENVGFTISPGDETEFYVRTTPFPPGSGTVAEWTNSLGESCGAPNTRCPTDLWVITEPLSLDRVTTIHAYGMAWTDAQGQRQERWRWRSPNDGVPLPRLCYWYGGTIGVVEALNRTAPGGIDAWKQAFKFVSTHVWNGTGTDSTTVDVAGTPWTSGTSSSTRAAWKVSTDSEVVLFLTSTVWSPSGAPLVNFDAQRWYSRAPGFGRVTLYTMKPVVLELLDGAGTLTVYPAL